MSRTAKNRLTIEPHGDGFRLFGYFNGENIRRKNKDVAPLQQMKAELEATDAKAQGIAEDEQALKTHISVEQLRGAEAAYKMLAGYPYSLTECVVAAMSVLGTGKPMPIIEARDTWLASLERRHRFERSIEDNKNRINAFIKQAGVKTVGEISSQMIEAYVYKRGLKPYTQAGRGRVVRTFLNFCLKQNWIRTSPFKVEMGDLMQHARRTAERPMILTPEQCDSLLRAALAYKDGEYVPYTVLSLFCFMRSAEAQRVLLKDIRFNGTSVVEVWPRKRGTASYRVVTIPANVIPILQAAIKKGHITDKVTKKGEPDGIAFSAPHWDNIRENAGIIKRTPAGHTSKSSANGRHMSYRKIIKDGSTWQENILRHTGVSYLFQKTGDINEVSRQAGHSEEIAFRHYLQLPQEGDSDRFYAITGEQKPLAAVKKSG